MRVLTSSDTLDSLSAEARVPACAIMRANRLYSPAWLIPGREIILPDTGFCLSANAREYPCPVGELFTPAGASGDI